MARDGDSLEQIARDRAEIKRKREEEEAVYERKMGRTEKTKHHKSTPDSSTTRLKETKNDESLSESKHKKRKHRHNSKEQTPLEAPIDAKEAHNPSPIDSKDAKEAHNPSIDSKDAKEAHNPKMRKKLITPVLSIQKTQKKPRRKSHRIPVLLIQRMRKIMRRYRRQKKKANEN